MGGRPDQSPPLTSRFDSTTGGVLTVEVGAITGGLELITRRAAGEGHVEALVRYAGARDLYTVAGSPLRTTKANHDIHEVILGRLTTPNRVEGENELPVDLTDPPHESR